MNRLTGKNVYLIGFMATGKSRVGRELAGLLGWPFSDTDHLIEKSAALTINEIFNLHGEAAFRDLESQIILKVSTKPHQVISLGGGAVIREENWRVIAGSGITICLTASLQTLVTRVQRKNDRPLLQNLSTESLQEKISAMMEQRLPHYQKADYRFESREEVSAGILAQKIYKRILES
jgi:shikimate kinase